MPRRRPRNWLAGRLRSAARAVDRVAAVLDISPTPGPSSGPAAPVGSGAGTGAGDGGSGAGGAGGYRRPGQPPEHWLRVVETHAPGLLRDLAIDPPPGGAAAPDGAHADADPHAGAGLKGGPGAGPEASAKAHRDGWGGTSHDHAETASAYPGPDGGTTTATTSGSPGVGPAPTIYSPAPFALLQPAHHPTSGIRTAAGASVEAEQRGDAGVSRAGQRTPAGTPPGGISHRQARPQGPPPVSPAQPAAGGDGAAVTAHRPRRARADRAGPGGSGADRTGADGTGADRAGRVASGVDGAARPGGARTGPARMPAGRERATTRAHLSVAPEPALTDRSAPAPPPTAPGPQAAPHSEATGTGPQATGTGPQGAGTGPQGAGTGRQAAGWGRLDAGSRLPTEGSTQPSAGIGAPARAVPRHVTDRHRTAGTGLADGEIQAGGRIPVGDGRWPGSGWFDGDGRWPGTAGVCWPDLESSPRSRAGWPGRDPWPALPDDRTLWSAAGPGRTDADHLRRLDGEQAGG
ncbi:hypothetical protein [Micromonospora sp. WMMD1082]|uniref:hypothetical protein n=1 Tax=Micromonospora sp. WMMD1082 TaxID=3016104 RepID=UPI0024175467|nr:hypothetical protein [Micromonospora sp. WMMD1082]MDG4797230.1 hypothetical protein [Micromonospora sp. WMMD1082]